MLKSPAELSSFAYRTQRVADEARALLTASAVFDSLSALAEWPARIRAFHKDGTWESTTRLLTGYGGYQYVATNNVIKIHQEEVLGLQESLRSLEATLRFCYQQGIDTRLFITPSHVFIVDLWRRLGYETMWSDFHREIVQLNTQVAHSLGLEPFPLWGFNHATGFVDEPIYKGRSSAKAVYGDGLHMRAKFSNQLLAEVWSGKARLGTPLNGRGVEAYIERVWLMADDFVAANTAQVKGLHKRLSLEEVIPVQHEFPSKIRTGNRETH